MSDSMLSPMSSFMATAETGADLAHQAGSTASGRKAIALISGGLDSMLAAKLVQQQGIHVEGINFFTGFCVEGHTHAIRDQGNRKPKRNQALWVAEQLGIKLHIIDVIEEYKSIVLNPKHGYGKNLNPCFDCKGFMVGKARQWMEEQGFDFIITGEVVGQRPMSQRQDAMSTIARESGALDLLLRPLSAKLLPVSRPEQEGWLEREKLLGLSGRDRKPQIALAQSLGFTEWAQPAGGCCFLTDPSYAKRLSGLWRMRGRRDYDFDDIMLLKVGRHLHSGKEFKLIIGREEGENNFLSGYRKQFDTLQPISHEGPLTLIDGEIGASDLLLAARLVARYSQGRDSSTVEVLYRSRQGEERTLRVTPLPVDEVSEAWSA